MSSFSDETIEQLAALSQIECSEQERHDLSQDLKKIFDYINLLQEVDIEGCPPCDHVFELNNVMREDAPANTLSSETFLNNAPDRIGGMIRVPPVLKQNNS